MYNPFDMLLFPEESEQEQSSWRWATVTSVSPLRIRFDGDAFPQTAPPVNLVDSLRIGTRVWVQLFRGRNVSGTRMFIHGPAGEPEMPPPSSAQFLSLDDEWNLPSTTYTWAGPMTPVTVGGLGEPQAEFAYRHTDRTNYGQGLQANVPGLFRVTAQVTFDGRLGGSRYMRFMVDTNVYYLFSDSDPPTGQLMLQGSAMARLEPGQRLGIQIYQSTTTPLTIIPTLNRTHLQLEYVGP